MIAKDNAIIQRNVHIFLSTGIHEVLTVHQQVQVSAGRGWANNCQNIPTARPQHVIMAYLEGSPPTDWQEV